MHKKAHVYLYIDTFQLPIQPEGTRQVQDYTVYGSVWFNMFPCKITKVGKSREEKCISLRAVADSLAPVTKGLCMIHVGVTIAAVVGMEPVFKITCCVQIQRLRLLTCAFEVQYKVKGEPNSKGGGSAIFKEKWSSIILVDTTDPSVVCRLSRFRLYLSIHNDRKLNVNTIHCTNHMYIVLSVLTSSFG